MQDSGTAGDFRYDAFISYRHAEMDKAVAERLHRALETYRVPGPLVKRGLPRQIKRVFRDREELPTSSNLSDDIQKALGESRCLIVICSPRTPESRWVTREVEIFIQLGRGDRILPVLIEGEPADSLPASVSGLLEPVADVRAGKLRRSLRLLAREKLRLIAHILGCGYSELESRDHERSIRQRTGLALAVFLLVSTVGFFNYSQYVRAEEQRKTTETERDRAVAAISLLTYETPESLGNVPGTFSILTAVFEENVELLDRILSLSPDSLEARRGIASNLQLACYGWLRLGDTRRAQEACDKALAISLALAQHEASAEARRDLSGIYEMRGDVGMAQGDLAGAREAYEKSLAIDLELAQGEADTEAQRNLIASYIGVGDVGMAQDDLTGAREAYENSLAVSLQLAQDKANAEAQHYVSVSYQRVGEVAMAQGDLTGSRDAYEKSLAIALELAQDKANAQAQRGLSAAYTNIGTARGAQGDLTGAHEAYQSAHAIALELAQDKSNARAQRDLSATYTNIGGVRMAEGDLAGARDAYEKSLAIQIELPQDKSNAQAQRDLSASYTNIGDVRMAEGDLAGARDAYEKSLAIALELAQDKTNADAQRQAGVLHERIGNVRRAQGDLTGALEAYQSAHAIALELAQDKSNAQAQRDLSISYTNIGGVKMAQGDLAGARQAYERVLAIRTDLAQDKANAEAQRDLAGAHGNMSWLELLDRRPKEAVSAALKGLEADPTQVWIKIRLAHGYLFDDQVDKARAIYVENKDVMIRGHTFAEWVHEDFKLLRENGITQPAMDTIEQLLQ